LAFVVCGHQAHREDQAFHSEAREDRLSRCTVSTLLTEYRRLSAMTRDILLNHGADVLNYVEGPVN
jgi:hypothetical protein